MKRIWNKIHNILKRNDGMTMVETLVALTVVAVFATGITGAVVTANASSVKADIISNFDRQNQMAISEFKTNPDPEYLKTVEPFKEMDYSAASVSFNKHYDKKFQPTNDSNAPYYVSYQYVTKTDDSGFSSEGKNVVLQIVNQKRMSNGTYENLQTSAAQGTGQIHTLSLTNTSVDPPPSPTPPSADTSFRVSFVVEGGTFKDETRDKRTVVVDKGTPLKNILPDVSELQADSSLPTRFTGWKKTGTTQVIQADTNMTVTSDLAISGAFEGIPCTVKFKLPYYQGSWSNNPAGETRSYVSQDGVTVDEDGLALLFGRSAYNDLFTGNVVFGGWFDDSGRQFQTGGSGTVLADDWNGKTVTARVTVPSVTVQVSVTEGEAAGIYNLSVPIGGTASTGDIAAAVGKDYSKIENTGRRVLSGWKRQDNGTEFVPGATVFTSDWNNSVIVTQYRNAIAANPDMTLNTEISDRTYWDISSSTIDFVQSGGNLQLRVKENPTKANTPPTVSEYKYYNLGDINTLKQKITDPGGDLKLNINVGYKYYSVKDYLQKYPDKKLYFNGKNDQSMMDKFNGSGAAFRFDGAAAAGLKQILGLTGNLELNPVFTSRVQTLPAAEKVLMRKRLGMFLELGAVSPKGRKNNEQYKLQLVRSNPPQEGDGTYVFKMGIIGENGDNILDSSKKMSTFAFRHPGEVNYKENAGMGADNLLLGAVGGPEWSNTGIIDQLTFMVHTRASVGANFRLEFDTEGPQKNTKWVPTGYHNEYMKRQFDNVKMTSDSVVKVNHLIVCVPNTKQYLDKSVSYQNLKPVNENGAYGKSQFGYNFHGGWLEQYMSWAFGGVISWGWPTGWSLADIHGATTEDQEMVDSGPSALPLPDNFEIK